jgi:FAD/FMN-containing dehydrogenase
VHLEYGSTMPTMLSTMHLYPVDGAARRVGGTDTAFSYRDATWSGVIGGIDPDPANADTIKQWCVDYWQALHPYSMGGSYVNFLSTEEGQDRVQAACRDNYARLTRVKAAYDPANLFHVNQNITPAA